MTKTKQQSLQPTTFIFSRSHKQSQPSSNQNKFILKCDWAYSLLLPLLVLKWGPILQVPITINKIKSIYPQSRLEDLDFTKVPSWSSAIQKIRLDIPTEKYSNTEIQVSSVTVTVKNLSHFLLILNWTTMELFTLLKY